MTAFCSDSLSVQASSASRHGHDYDNAYYYDKIKIHLNCSTRKLTGSLAKVELLVKEFRKILRACQHNYEKKSCLLEFVDHHYVAGHCQKVLPS